MATTTTTEHVYVSIWHEMFTRNSYLEDLVVKRQDLQTLIGGLQPNQEVNKVVNLQEVLGTGEGSVIYRGCDGEEFWVRATTDGRVLSARDDLDEFCADGLPDEEASALRARAVGVDAGGVGQSECHGNYS